MHAYKSQPATPFPDSFFGEFLGPTPDARVAEANAHRTQHAIPQNARTRIMRHGFDLAAFAAVLLCSTPGIAQDYRGTAEQRASCMPDAFRLCASYIPDASRVEMCLRQQKAELSQACRSVFEEHEGAVVSRIRTDGLKTN